jgi:hypothetical protein
MRPPKFTVAQTTPSIQHATRALIAAAALGWMPACNSSCPMGLVKTDGVCHRESSSAVDAGIDASTGSASSSVRAASDASLASSGRPASGNTGGTGTDRLGAAGVSPATSSFVDAGLAGKTGAAGQAEGIAGSPSSGAAGSTPTSSNPCPNGGSPGDETCDGRDNDCDGQVDEDLGEMACGSSMQGICRLGRKSCTAGHWSDCVGAIEPSMEICDAQRMDENCDGTSNEHCACTPGETQECGMSGGICRPGTQACTSDGTWEPTCKGAITPQPEACDGMEIVTGYAITVPFVLTDKCA